MSAISIMQHPKQFVEAMSSSIAKRSHKLLHLISVVHSALLEIVSIASPNLEENLAGLHTSLTVPLKLSRSTAESSWIAATHTPDKRSTKSTPQHSEHVSRILSGQYTQSSSETMTLLYSPLHDISQRLGPAVEDVLVHYCEILMDVVRGTVLRSHDQFSNSLWSKPSKYLTKSALLEEEEEERAKRGSRVVSFNVPDSPEKVDSLAEVMKQDGSKLQEKLRNFTSARYTQLEQ